MVPLLPKVLWCTRESQALTVIQMAVLNKYVLKCIYLIHLALYSFVFLVKPTNKGPETRDLFALCHQWAG